MAIRWDEDTGTVVNPNRVDGGTVAKNRGEMAESEFDLSAKQYERFGQLSWHDTHAKFVEIGRTTVKRQSYSYGYWEKQGGADRLAILPGGQACFIEVKSALPKAKTKPDQWILRHSMHQYDGMLEAFTMGALCFYAVRWLDINGRLVEWRMHPLDQIDKAEKKITFIRTDGLPVPMATDGLPEWLPAVTHYQETQKDKAANIGGLTP